MTTYINVFDGDVVQPTDVSYNSLTIDDDVTLLWPSLSTSSLNFLARIMDVDATGTQQITLPPANQASVGQDALFNCVGSSSIDLLDADGNSITSLSPGDVKYLYITDNSTAAGVWAVFTFGTGTSGADAIALAGRGLKALSNKLVSNQNVSASAVTPSQITLSNRASVFSWIGGTGILNLDSVDTLLDGFWFGVVNAGTGTLTVTPDGVETINDEVSLILNPGDSCLLFADDEDNWVSIGLGRNTEFAFGVAVIDITAGGLIPVSDATAANKIIQLQGTPGAITSVNFPAVASVYWVTNNASGPQTVFLGINGVADYVVQIQAGQHLEVVVTGTNIFPATDLSVTAAGSSTEIQFNTGGVLDASSDLTWDGVTFDVNGVGHISGQFGVGIVGAVSAHIKAVIGGDLPSNTNRSITMYVGGVVPNTTTSDYTTLQSAPATANSAFTLTTAYHFLASNLVLGAGSALTNQYGFFASNFTSGASNFGFYGALNSGANVWNTYMAGTAKNFFQGSLGIGVDATDNSKVTIGGTLPTTTNQSFGVNSFGTTPAGSTTASTGFRSRIVTAASAFTVTDARNFAASDGSLGAGSAITNQTAYYSEDLTVGTNNFGFYGSLSAGANKYNLYMTGTAKNYLAGQLGLGQTTPNANAKLDIVSTTQGVLFPRMTTAQKNAIAGPSGLVVYDTTLNKLCVYGAAAWETITSV